MFKILVILLEISKVQTIEQLRILLDSKKFLFQLEFGFSVPSGVLTLVDKVNIVRTLTLHYLIYAN